MRCLLLAQLSGDGLVGVVWVLGVYESLLVAGRDDCATLLIEFVLHLSQILTYTKIFLTLLGFWGFGVLGFWSL